MNRKQGFTLIELIVVMAILAILMAIGAGAFTSSLKKGRDTTRKGNLRAITNALEMYYNDKGKYPIGTTGTIPGCYNAGGGTGACGTDYPIFKDSVTNGAMWMAKFPVDPVVSQKYYYVSDAQGKQFQLYAHLENNQDPTIMTPAASPTDCGSGACNWGLSSANINP